MDTKWLKGCKTAEEKEARKQELLQHSQAFEDLTEILKGLRREGSVNYDSPSWAYEQADRNGANSMLDRVIKLIDLKR